mgnify:CR=1 FL=1
MRVNVVELLNPIGLHRVDRIVKLVAAGLDPTSERKATVYSPFRTRLKKVKREVKPISQRRKRGNTIS